MPLGPARLWFEENAKFIVPPHEPISTSTSSSLVSGSNVDRLEVQAPSIAVFDGGMHTRLIQSLDLALGDTLLQATPQGSAGYTDEEVDGIYSRLFADQVRHRDGIQYDMWESLSNEVVCNRLIDVALLHAVKSVTWRMFGRRIRTRTEPMPPSHGTNASTGNSKERVDMKVEDEHGNVVHLGEGKNPNVMRALDSELNRQVFSINLTDNTSNGIKVFNKLIYYMLLWEQDWIWVCCFSKIRFFRIHRLDVGVFLSFSEGLELDLNTEPFRALLALTLINLGLAEYHDFDVARAILANISRVGISQGPHTPGDTYGSSGSRGPSSTRNSSGSSRTGSTSTPGSASGGRRRANTKKSTGAKKRPSGRKSWPFGTVVEFLTIGRRITRSMSVIKISATPGSNFPVLGTVEFERDPRAPFPPLPTSAHLNVLYQVGGATAGLVYVAELHSANDCRRQNYIIKVVHHEWQDHDQYFNSPEQLKKEYKSYYLFASAKRAGGYDEVLEKFTVTCYGLFRLRRQGEPQDVFALILDYAGPTLQVQVDQLPMEEKKSVLRALLGLHIMGAYHGDTHERNIVRCSDGSFKFIDYGNSEWHKCPGMQKCRELESETCNVFSLFGFRPPPIDVAEFERSVLDQYPSAPYNLEEKMGRNTLERINEESAVKRLCVLAAEYARGYEM
ncbi:uncharacterized protein FOMMEDRAFT_164784 [Fomitiporia mediterranea MF3/22]|uniref:uncharacterized protein n=1 Tax=Fomitiporia mediterranea (strain MF3/22) TaxID=694068 RepID=UPI0004408ABC|nr:uncharacterized protein FOMMEDRAFT_164784 [Fomitiporia mediterranea MF3/22]EJD08004.1 hypothetical protein FOMMEDRAFT_164784 [Fomitiporia mediterranea MF3/22]